MEASEADFRETVSKLTRYMPSHEVMEMALTFIQDTEIGISELSGFFENDDLEGQQRCLHTIKGNSQTMGATNVAHLCKHAESQLKMIGSVPQKALLLQQLGDALLHFKSLVNRVSLQ